MSDANKTAGWRLIQDGELIPWGTPVLLYWPYWSFQPVIGHYTNQHWYSDSALSDDGPGPTHWMPLPELPK